MNPTTTRADAPRRSDCRKIARLSCEALGMDFPATRGEAADLIDRLAAHLAAEPPASDLPF